ncbi:hypothetical protein BGZ49_008590 [Haplosporangium sp. Z 27]|nr:hypothetical protein BGZ49_008590 [Haplosporangium sp. Z 27]
MSHNRPRSGQSRNVNSGSANAATTSSTTRPAGGHASNHDAQLSQNSHGALPIQDGKGSAGNQLNSISRQQDTWIKARQIHQQQLLTEHFGFSPLSFVDDVINSVNNMIYQASMALQEYVETQMDDLAGSNLLPDDVDVKDESAKCMHKFETLLESAVDKNFDRFELYALKNLFGVPEDVDIVLPHYEALDFNIGVEREQQLDEQLEILRRKVIATKALNYRLRKELEIEENRRRQLKKCQEQIQFLKDAVTQYGDVVPVPQTLIFVRDNIETLHRRFASLHDKLQQNANRNANTNGSSSGFNSTSGASSLNPASSPNYQPADSVTLALHESLLNVEPDQRSIYIRSVVRRQIDEQLVLDSSFAANSGHHQAPPTP